MRHDKSIAHTAPASDQERAARNEAVERFRIWHRKRKNIGMSVEEILDLVQKNRRW